MLCRQPGATDRSLRRRDSLPSPTNLCYPHNLERKEEVKRERERREKAIRREEQTERSNGATEQRGEECLAMTVRSHLHVLPDAVPDRDVGRGVVACAGHREPPLPEEHLGARDRGALPEEMNRERH